MGRFLTIFSVFTKNNSDMKACHVIITSLFFSFLPLTNLFGQSNNESPPTSYVAEIKKKQGYPVSTDNNPGYIYSQKTSNVSSSNSTSKKNSFLEDHYQPETASSPDSYLAKINKKQNASTDNDLSYVSYQKKKEINVVVFVSEKAVVDTQKNKINPVVSSKPKKVSRIVIFTNPIKKAWNKVFSSKKKSSVPTNFDNDLSFDPSDYESIASWAERCGKTYQAQQVVENYGEIIKSFSIEFGVDYRVIIAICAHESGGNPNVVSSAGACGLMQLMPGTAATYGVYESDIFDPYMNLRAGTHYFSDMIKMFGNTKDAIYAYGWGHNKAKKRFREGVQSDEVEGVQQVLYLAQVQ